MKEAIKELRRSINEDSTLDTRRVQSAVEDLYNSDTGIITDVSLEDHLLIHLTKGFLETGYNDSDVLNYVSSTFGNTAFWENAPSNHDFIPYRIDNLDNEREYLSRTTGDLALFNTGFLHSYHKKKHSPIDHTYFKQVGKEAYSHAAERTPQKELEQTLTRLSQDFNKAVSALRYAANTASPFP